MNLKKNSGIAVHSWQFVPITFVKMYLSVPEPALGQTQIDAR